MTQAMLRIKATHNPDSMEGQAYLPNTLFFTVDTTGSGDVAFWTAAPGTYVQEVFARISEAFDSGTTVDIGDEDTAAKFIANNEWTESTLNQVANSRQTTAPDGVFYPTAKQLKVTVGGASPTTGQVQILVSYFNLNEMAAQGIHNSVSI